MVRSKHQDLSHATTPSYQSYTDSVIQCAKTHTDENLKSLPMVRSKHQDLSHATTPSYQSYTDSVIQCDKTHADENLKIFADG